MYFLFSSFTLPHVFWSYDHLTYIVLIFGLYIYIYIDVCYFTYLFMCYFFSLFILMFLIIVCNLLILFYTKMP